MDAGTFVFGSFMLDPATGIVLRNGVPIAIGRRGLAILETLLKAGAP